MKNVASQSEFLPPKTIAAAAAGYNLTSCKWLCEVGFLQCLHTQGGAE